MVDDPAGTPESDDPLRRVQADLDYLDGLELPDQVAVYERLHSGLAGALARTAEQPGPVAGGR